MRMTIVIIFEPDAVLTVCDQQEGIVATFGAEVEGEDCTASDVTMHSVGNVTPCVTLCNLVPRYLVSQHEALRAVPLPNRRLFTP